MQIQLSSIKWGQIWK